MSTEQNIKEYERRLEVMRAHAAGKPIQFRRLDSNIEWADALAPGWYWDNFDYCVKPRAPRTFKLAVSKRDGSGVTTTASETSRGYYPADRWEIIEVVEVVKDYDNG